jgi:hypothetical protein
LCLGVCSSKGVVAVVFQVLDDIIDQAAFFGIGACVPSHFGELMSGWTRR